MIPDPIDASAAAYIDGKADAARRHAKRDPQSAEMHHNTARVLEAAADEIRMGLHRSDNA